MNRSCFFSILILAIAIIAAPSTARSKEESNPIFEESLRFISPGNIKALEGILFREGDKTKTEEFNKIKSAIDFDELRTKLLANNSNALAEIDVLNAFARTCFSKQINSPILFTKRHPYYAGHIYDDYLEWHPGGGIYILENPLDIQSKHRVVPVIDEKTKESLGKGVYRDPDVSYNGKKILFSFKGRKEGGTSIYEINTDGTGLKRLSNPDQDLAPYEFAEGTFGEGHHDITPCYMPDNRIVFTSTRQRGHVLCFSSHVDILHTMNADGTDVKPISVSPLNEFDPVVMPDGRLMYGRWEYVDKSALYIQSLWVVNPDGTNETAYFGNNLGKPTAILDPRPVPGTDLIACSLTPHNGQAVGAIAMIDTKYGKNNLAGIFNFTPEYPIRMGQGLREGACDPFPLNRNTVIVANNDKKHGNHGVLELIDRTGFRMVLHREEHISCYAPIPVKGRDKENIIPSSIVEGEPGRFFVSDIYQGLEGVEKGAVKWLRIIETETRVTGNPPNGRWWNQANLISWQGSYDVKNIIGLVPVEEDGSAYFDVPLGKALYFQALDKEKRMIQSQRTFVQALPGITRSCVGCHDEDATNSVPNTHRALALKKAPEIPRPESWGAGHVDYATHIQPILDKNCVSCHGGKNGISSGIDLSGGWTWAFNISYETLIKHVFTGFLNCENMQEEALSILPPYTHGSGAAQLTNLLKSGHKGRINLTEEEEEIIMAWMDGNCNYYGTWDYTEYAVNDYILKAGKQLGKEMEKAGCVKCHQDYVGNDWVNFKDPEMSRILRAPMQKDNSYGLQWCRNRKIRNGPMKLVRSSMQPPDVLVRKTYNSPEREGKPVVTFKDSNNKHYRSMLKIIQNAKKEILKTPRVDMPGAEIVKQKCLLPETASN